jgi:hypothetical protein
LTCGFARSREGCLLGGQFSGRALHLAGLSFP